MSHMLFLRTGRTQIESLSALVHAANRMGLKYKVRRKGHGLTMFVAAEPDTPEKRPKVSGTHLYLLSERGKISAYSHAAKGLLVRATTVNQARRRGFLACSASWLKTAKIKLLVKNVR